MWPVADRFADWPAVTLAPIMVTLPLPLAASPLAVMFNAPPAASWLPWAMLWLLLLSLSFLLTPMLLLTEIALMGRLGSWLGQDPRGQTIFGPSA